MVVQMKPRTLGLMITSDLDLFSAYVLGDFPESFEEPLCCGYSSDSTQNCPPPCDSVACTGGGIA